ncbi:MAG TPA: FAD-binding oxidoreductase [Candidatus Paceibacterota bacterium]|nr:FAD-binding oxidoreductase [Candidatus Paceibacterota bacterium]
MTDLSDLRDDLAGALDGDVTDDPAVRKEYSRDTSLFEETPGLVVFPKNAQDVSRAVRLVADAKRDGLDISIAGRSAGTDMTGGPLTSGVSLVFTKYMNRFLGCDGTVASTEPGVYYRDFEKETLKKGVILPSYPASRELCAMGGIVSNNSGGEKTLRYGKTNRYIESLDVVLADGSIITTEPLDGDGLAQKEALETFEGEIYRKLHALIEGNRDAIEAARPRVSKNSAGYYLWNVMDPPAKQRDPSVVFDLGQLICGSQGTLGLVTKETLTMVHTKEKHAMLVIFLRDIGKLPEIVKRVLRYEPESFESYDDKTFNLAVRFFPQIVQQIGISRLLSLGISFLPEAGMVLRGGLPTLVLMADFAEDTQEEADRKAREAHQALAGLPVTARTAGPGIQSEKYWIIRRESFSLLRKNAHGLYAAPFIDDLIIPPDQYPVFLPKLTALLSEYDLLYTIAGHIGDGNFHIIPLVDLGKPETRKTIEELTPRVYKLVLAHGGSITAEHNDGIIRTPYLPLQYGETVMNLFAEVKRIMDPLGILNPGKKVGGTVADIDARMVRATPKAKTS